MLKIILIVLILFFLVDLLASFYFYNLAVARSKKKFLVGNEDLPASSSSTRGYDYRAWLERQDYKTVEIKSEDGLKLKACYLKANESNRPTVILAHGYASRGKSMANFAKFYYESLAYNVLVPDNRGHASSEGAYIGFGWADRKDYVRWIDYVLEQFDSDSQIVLHGVSMGGATVLMTSGENLPANVKAIVSDCAYTSVEEQLAYQLSRMYKIPSFPILKSTSILTKIRAGYSFEEASALEQVKKTKIPILFVHGKMDKFVPYEMLDKLYKACKSEKDVLVVDDASHGDSYAFDQEAYEQKLSDFLSSYIVE